MLIISFVAMPTDQQLEALNFRNQNPVFANPYPPKINVKRARIYTLLIKSRR
jgi:hypothetical protein